MKKTEMKSFIEENMFLDLEGWKKPEKENLISVLAKNLRERGLNARKYDGHLIVKTKTNKLSLWINDIEKIAPEKNLIWIYGKEHSVWVKIQNDGIMEILA